jgi:hypothetical protein
MEELRHEITGAIGARTPQGDIIYGPLAEQYLQPAPQVDRAAIQSEIDRIQGEIHKLTPQVQEARGVIDAGTLGASPMEIPDPIPSPFVREIEDSTTGFLSHFQQQQDTYAQMMEQAEKQQQQAFDKLEDAMAEKPSMADMMETLGDKYGLPEQFKRLQALAPEIDAINQRLIQTELAEQQALMGAEGRMAPMTFIRGEQALIQRQYGVQKAAISAELGAKAALGQMYQGNIELANSMIDRTIQAHLYDYDQKISDYQFFFEHYSDEFNRLDSEYKNAIENQFNLIQKQEEIEREDLKEKYNLIQSAWESGIDPALSAAQIQSMSYEQLMERVGPQITAAAVDKAQAGGILEFTTLEKKKLEQAGIDWRTTDGYQKALDFLYGEKIQLTSTQINQIAEMGVPKDTATDIQQATLQGFTFDEIHDAMIKSGVDPVTAGRNVDAYREVVARTGIMSPEALSQQLQRTRGHYQNRGQQIEQERIIQEQRQQKETITGGKTYRWFDPRGWL